MNRHGLVSFGLAMFAALILYLRLFEEVFSLAGPRLPRLGLANPLRRIAHSSGRQELANS